MSDDTAFRIAAVYCRTPHKRYRIVYDAGPANYAMVRKFIRPALYAAYDRHCLEVADDIRDDQGWEAEAAELRAAEESCFSWD